MEVDINKDGFGGKGKEKEGAGQNKLC
jgi:hypothetical protein